MQFVVNLTVTNKYKRNIGCVSSRVQKQLFLSIYQRYSSLVKNTIYPYCQTHMVRLFCLLFMDPKRRGSETLWIQKQIASYTKDRSAENKITTFSLFSREMF